MRHTSGPAVLTFVINASCSAIPSLQMARQSGVDLPLPTALEFFLYYAHTPLNKVPFIGGEDDPYWPKQGAGVSCPSPAL